MSVMKICRWGNSLAVRLPAEMVKELGLKEGDYVERDRLALRRAIPKLTREEALEWIKNARWPIPEGYKFDREEANSRGE